MHQISKVVRTKAMLIQAIHIWWKANERFLLYIVNHCLPLRSSSCSHGPTHLVPIDNKASELTIASSSMSREFPQFESCCRASALLATLSYTESLPLS